MKKNLSRRDFLKGAAAGSLGLAMVGLMGCSAQSETETSSAAPVETTSAAAPTFPSSLYIPGTYSATVKGYAAYITVEMTFSADAITECIINPGSETPTIGGVAAQEMASLIVENQSVDVTSSASAAITVPAIKKAANNCIAQAQGTAAALNERENEDDTDWLGVAPEIDDSQISSTLDTSLLIVGAGNGGMMAAATAADAGMDFIICEQNTTPCEARFWIGAVNTEAVKQAGLTVNKNRLLNELGRYASYKCDLDVIKVWIDYSAEMVSYLESLGMNVVVNPAPESHVGGDGMEYYVPTTWHTIGTTEDFATAELPFTPGNRNLFLEKHINSKGYEISYNMTLVRLVQDANNKVIGAIFTNANGEYVKINADNVILATGGYAGNPKMIKALTPIANETVTSNFYYAPNKGMGIRAGIWAGGLKSPEAAPMIFDRGIVAPGVKAGYVDDGNGGLTFPSSMDQFILGSQPYLKVNKEGERFMNESLPYDFQNFTAAFQTDGVYACIMDANVTEDILAYDQYGCAKVGVLIAQAGGVIPTLEGSVQQGLVFKADTIEDLAKQLNIPADTLRATVDRYNDLCSKGVDEDFGKEGYRMRPVIQAPFYGYFLGGTLLTTMDGLRINRKCQVYDANRKVIEGLYSVGDCSGSYFSGNYPEFIVGAAVGRTLTQGRYAVKAILGEEF